MKKVCLIMIGVIFTSIVYSQKLRWVSEIPRYVDLVDKKQNIFVAGAPYGIQDIDPGENILNIDEGISGTYVVKYAPDFHIEWYKTNKLPDYFRYTIMCNNDSNELFLLINKNRNLEKNSSEYHIAKFLQDGNMEYSKKAFYLELGDGPIFSDLFDIHSDSLSNIWISGMIAGKAAFGESGMVESIPNITVFIARYDENGNLLKVIKRNTDKYFGMNYRKTNLKIDQKGTIHQIIYENNAYSYLTTDTLGKEAKVKIINSSNAKVTASHLLLSDSCFFVIGTFTDAFDIDNSEKIKSLSPKGTKDIYFAKYNITGQLLNAWSIGGTGSLTLSDNVKLKNNNLIITLISEARTLVNYSLDSDKVEVELNRQLANVCYDMSIESSVIDTISSSNDDLVADISPGPAGSNPMYLVNLRDTLYFVANDGKTGYELWKSDGTASGTVLIKDLTPGGDSFNPNVNNTDRYPIMANSRSLFVAPDTLPNGNSVWITGGDSGRFTNLSNSLAFYKFVVNDKFYAQQLDDRYLISDGTENGTVSQSFDIDNSFLRFNHILNKDSVIYYYSYTFNSSYNFISSDIYSFDGESFTKIFSFDKPIYSLETFKGKLYFYELDNFIVPKKLSSVHLDGSNYSVVYSFTDNTVRTDEAKFTIKNTGDKLLFMGYDNVHKLELWVSDGSTLNTHLLKDLHPLESLKVNNFVLAKNNILFFSADDGNGMDIFQTDGTSEGTLKLRGLSPFGKVNYNSMAIVNEILFFGATNDDKGCELWKYKFINKIEVQKENLSYSTDSSQIKINMEIEIYPKDATDTSLTYSLVENNKYNATIDSTGEIILLPKPDLKSATLNDTIQIKIEANDGSKRSIIHKLAINDLPATVKTLDNDFLVWPNPATEKLNIATTSGFIETIFITDISGRTIFQKSYNRLNNVSLDISSFSKGLFFVKVMSNGNYSVKKFQRR